MIKKGKFTSRSEAIKSMINSYSEREKTREFYKLLVERSKDAKEHPEKLIPFSEL
jgi:Arc/MetJ-type ribon-helix-helix transcriptional regulator